MYTYTFQSINSPVAIVLGKKRYTPSLALCVVAIVLFALGTIVHLLQVIRHRAWTFLLVTFACLLETIGYAFRTLSSRNDPYNVIWFVVQYFLIVVAPVFISAGIYFSITGLVAWADTVQVNVDGAGGAAAAAANNDQDENKNRRRWWLSRKLILWGFIAADVLTTTMQIAGAALVGSSESNEKNPAAGNDILLAGLALQTLSFTAFLLVLLLFRLSLSGAPGSGSNNNKTALRRSKDVFILAVAAASLLVYLRTVFRLAETAQGLFGDVSTNETFFATLEFAPVGLAVCILAAWHPGRYLGGRARR